MLPEHLADLLHPRAYPHRCDTIELVETHISWVLLTGEYVYKIKRPVDFGFVDFSTLSRRRMFCGEEIRLNRRFAPSLYLDVVRIARDDGGVAIDGTGEVVEYAVQMRQFEATRQLDRRLADGRLEAGQLAEFGASLAHLHAGLPRCDAAAPFGAPTAVFAPVAENFKQIAGSVFAPLRAAACAELSTWSEMQHAELEALFASRRAAGFVRECHGDLHLSNLVQLDDGIHAFDCIEFSEPLRWIDVISDVAFLVMDCAVRGRDDIGHAFLDGYLERSGDYAGCALLRFYLAYRSMVRAKVAALQAQQLTDAELRRRFEMHVDYALARTRRTRGMLIVMCGLSGSGKSWLAERLVPVLPALRIRSDVERKRLAGIAVNASSESAIDSGLYARRQTDAVYARLADAAQMVIGGGETAIVDATFLDPARRRAIRERSAALGVPCVTVYCMAPFAVLEQRVAQRAAAGRDASEATLEVLQVQRRDQTPPTAAEGPLVTVDTSLDVESGAIAEMIRAAAGRADGY
jgi:uncharacterized protein